MSTALVYIVIERGSVPSALLGIILVFGLTHLAGLMLSALFNSCTFIFRFFALLPAAYVLNKLA